MNLADIQARETQQADKLARRSSILPERRNTTLKPLEQNATMASARRGDVGGAEALMKTLGLLQRAGDDVAQATQAQHAQREQDNIAQGALDQQVGRVDPEMEQKSLGYRNAVTKGRTMSEFNGAMRDFDAELRDMIDDDNDVDLTARRQRVLDRTEQFFAEFATDPETGQLKPFLQTPGALRYLAEGISASRGQIEATAMRRIEAKFDGETVNHFSQSVIDQPVMTGGLDLELAMSVLSDTVQDETVRDAFTKSLSQAASRLWIEKKSVDGLRLLDAVLGRPAPLAVPVPEAAPEGTLGLPMVDPVTAYERDGEALTINGLDKIRLAAGHMLALREARENLANRIRQEWQAEVEEEQSFNSSSMALRLYGQGAPLTSVEITQALGTNAISAQAAMSLYDLWRRSTEEAQRYADRQQAERDRAEHDAEQAAIEAATGRYISALASRRMSPAQARERVLQELPGYRSPRVAAAILNGVMAIAGDVETSTLNGAGVRDRIGGLDRDLRDVWRREFAKPQYGLTGQRQARLVSQADAIIDRMQADFLSRVQEGDSPEAAQAATNARFGPLLNALLPRRP